LELQRAGKTSTPKPKSPLNQCWWGSATETNRLCVGSFDFEIIRKKAEVLDRQTNNRRLDVKGKLRLLDQS